MNRLFLTASLLVLAFATCHPAGAQVSSAWSQFLGPDRTGIATEKGLLRAWPEEGPPILWRRSLGGGFAGVAISGAGEDGDLLYTAFAENGTEGAVSYLAALRVADGTEVWRLSLGPSFTDEFGTGPRATPTLADGRVFALSAQGYLVAAEASSGKKLWGVDLFEKYGCQDVQWSATGGPQGINKKRPTFGYSQSPLVEAGHLIVETGAGEGRSIVALDPATGTERWTALSGLVGYASPVAMTLAGKRQIVVPGQGAVVGLSTDGKELWRHPWMVSMGQPMAVGEDRVFLSTIQNDVGGVLLRIGSEAPEVLWENPRMRNFWSSTIAWNGQLFGFDNSTFRCLDAETGEILWSRRGLGKGSTVIADGLLFILSDQGVLVLAEATPEEFRERGRVRFFDEGRTWTPPALRNGYLYLRSPSEIARLDVRGEKR